MAKKAIITGITGQDGAYLSKLLLEKGYEIIGFVRSKTILKTDKLKYLDIEGKINFVENNLLNYSETLNQIDRIQPNEIYNLAAQSSVGNSFLHPLDTLNFNISSVLNLLESILQVNKSIRFYQASSSEMFGRVEHLPITEDHTFNPISPYATSKASAHWIVKNYRSIYKIFAVSGILFNHESFLRDENFFIKKVIRHSLEIKEGKRDFLYVGNIDIKRDFGYSPDYVVAMWKMLNISLPDDYIICSGKSISLREIIYYVFYLLGIDKNRMIVDQRLYRVEDIENIYGDNSKAREKLQWNYKKDFFDVLKLLIEEEEKNYNL